MVKDSLRELKRLYMGLNEATRNGEKGKAILAKIQEIERSRNGSAINKPDGPQPIRG